MNTSNQVKFRSTCGVYMLRHPVTCDSYIGASCDLKSRFRMWRLQTLGGTTLWLLNALLQWDFFEDIEIDAIELRVIEYVDVPPDQICRLSSYRKATPAVLRLLDREAYWIRTLRPTLNVKGNRKIETDAIPIGPPEN